MNDDPLVSVIVPAYNISKMKREKFDEHCKWIFEVLHHLEIRIDIGGYSDQEKSF